MSSLTQKRATSLLPYLFLKKAADQGREVNVVRRDGSGIKIVQEKADEMVIQGAEVIMDKPLLVDSNRFIHFPPVDIQVRHPNHECVFFESKMCIFDKESFEIIMRQDFFAGNLLRRILIKNNRLEDAESETPVMLCLLWKPSPNISFDLVVFTDLALMNMIMDSTSSRAEAARQLIHQAYDEQYIKTGRVEYKLTKGATVPHQKISFHPMKTHNKAFEKCKLNFDMNMDYVDDFPVVKPERSFWHLVELEKLSQPSKKQRIS